MSFWNALRIGLSGLDAQRLRLDLIANNIANAETTHTASGGPYQRKDIVLTPQSESSFQPMLSVSRSRSSINRGFVNPIGGVQVNQVVTDQEPGTKVYDPSHPDADDEGFVEYPNVNIVVEMTNMISATRSYEANLSIIEAAKNMALKALEIGR